ncbi:MAG: hypothetical protein H6Q70_494 [Firmicutes bacterium]|nr:hypothetical protein [Bacillota bacterium]
MITNERLNEMIKTAELFAAVPCGLELNEINAKDIYAAFVELKKLREENKKLKTGYLELCYDYEQLRKAVEGKK